MKKAFVLVVDTSKMFDVVKAAGDAGVGSRLACAALSGGDVNFAEAIGLAVYGIEIREYTGPDLECKSCDVTPAGHAIDCPEAQD